MSEPGAESEKKSDASGVADFLGGPPLQVFLKLVLISAIVGLILSIFGFKPWNVLWRLEEIFWSLFDNFYDFVRSVFEWVLVGMVIVVPLFLLKRFLSSGKS